MYDSVVLCLNCGVLIWWEVRCFILWYVYSIIWMDYVLSKNELVSLNVLYYYPRLVTSLLVWMNHTIIHHLSSGWNHVDNDGVCQVGKPLILYGKPCMKEKWLVVVFYIHPMLWNFYCWISSNDLEFDRSDCRLSLTKMKCASHWQMPWYANTKSIQKN